jgi:endonuclease YncB( thermonuclease family)
MVVAKVLYRVAITLIIFVLATPAFSYEKIVGYPTVHDGDSLKIGKQKIRLYGIDAPELSQKCRLQKEKHSCGISSRDYLIQFINNQEVSCEKIDTDRYKRIVARCYVNGTDINKNMVRTGHALAYTTYSKDYIEVQKLAKEERIGIWNYKFEEPWNFRKKSKK